MFSGLARGLEDGRGAQGRGRVARVDAGAAAGAPRAQGGHRHSCDDRN